MSSKNQRVELQCSSKTFICMDMNILPCEVLLIIFFYLDKKSISSVSETCKLWFELIRSNSNISSHICLVQDGLSTFKTKLEQSEWIWERWPVLKILEFGRSHMVRDHMADEPHSAKEAMNLVKSINFKQCKTLEKVVFSVNFDKDRVYSTRNFMSNYCMFATMEEITFNPHVEISTTMFHSEFVQEEGDSFGIEHVSNLHLSLAMDVNANRTCEGLQMIGEKAKYLKELTVSLERTKSICKTKEGLDLLVNTFHSMFVGLNDSLETIQFCNNEDNYNLDFAVLKILSEHCKNIAKIVLVARNQRSRYPEIGYFRNLKELTVPRLCYIESFGQNYHTVTDLCIENEDIASLEGYDLKTMCQNFKKLIKCTFIVRVNQLLSVDFICSVWQKIVDETFKERTEVKFVFRRKHKHSTVTKLPYQKSKSVLHIA